MEGSVPTTRPHLTARNDSWVWLAVRIGAALIVATAAGIAADRLAEGLVAPNQLIAAAAGVLTACAVGGLLLAAVIAPLARSRVQLTEAYRAAVADSLRDQLTGLGNHRAFQEELDRQVEEAHRYGNTISLAIIDLDEFKRVNDTAGHAQGDRALGAFGSLLATAVRRSDRCFRIGGDEFAILFPHTDAQGARIVARRLLAAALALDEEEAEPFSFSAGISSLPDLAASRAELYTQADSALYAAKRSGRTEVVVFDPRTGPQSTAAESSAAVAEVIARGQLRPAFQPIVNIEDDRVLGYEGLIRPVPPAPFESPLDLFAAAEGSGHLAALELTSIETLVRAARALPFDQFLSVNISPRTVESADFSAAALLSILARHGFPAERLVLELTEHHPIDEISRVREKLDACRRAAIRLAADDLGSGNAGLRLLSELRFDILKVDLTLVQRSARGGPSSDVVESVVGLAARTGALVIGEGVEHPEQLRQLTALGVVAAQGHLLGRPGPLPEFSPEPLVASIAIRTGALPPRRADEPPAESMTAWRQSIGLPT